MNDLEKFEQRQLEKVSTGKKIPAFAPGDTVRVNVKIVENTGKEQKTRIQSYEGVCISRSKRGVQETFTVRKISYGEGVERVFPLFSPSIDSIELVRRGSVRRAKLYYLRDRSGKSARIDEKTERDTDGDTKASNATAPAVEKKAVNA